MRVEHVSKGTLSQGTFHNAVALPLASWHQHKFSPGHRWDLDEMCVEHVTKWTRPACQWMQMEQRLVKKSYGTTDRQIIFARTNKNRLLFRLRVFENYVGSASKWNVLRINDWKCVLCTSRGNYTLCANDGKRVQRISSGIYAQCVSSGRYELLSIVSALCCRCWTATSLNTCPKKNLMGTLQLSSWGGKTCLHFMWVPRKWLEVEILKDIITKMHPA